jgi:hypothetical protein
VLGGQTPFAVVQIRVVTPAVKPLTVVDGSFGVEIFPAPEKMLHVPVPVVGALADSVTEFPVLKHNVWSLPALAGSGSASTMMVI